MPRTLVKRLAGLELNTLLYSRVLPPDLFDGTWVRSSGTPIYDINGEVLFYRVPIVKGRTPIAFADIAAHSAFSSPLLAIHIGLDWKPRNILNQAANIARKKFRNAQFNRMRFVSYSYPKIAVQFLQYRRETLMLELFSWEPIPPIREREPEEPPSNFERWSLIAETPENRKQKNLELIEERVANWDEICPPLRPPQEFKPERLRTFEFTRAFEQIIPILSVDIRELHYSLEETDHHPCYELRGQLTRVWCVAASVQMILDFYRYNYEQTRLADELGLGTLDDPNGLPYARDGDVVTVLEALTNNALDANMNVTPNWAEFRDEIRANRPLISFKPGHSRTVAGYVHVRLLPWLTFRGLLVYDPWPPTTGVITRWENFDTMTYRRTFTAQLTLQP